jgi:hypothetical protein
MQKKINITSGLSLSKIIEAVIDNSRRATLERNAGPERQFQASLSEEDDIFDDADDSGGNDEENDSSSSATMKDEKSKLKTGDITADDVVNRLNIIRSGKSFKDEEIAGKLKEYIDSLTKAERTALLAFLKGISQVVTGDMAGKDALDPSDSPSNVEMKKGEDVKKITIKPTIVKNPEKGEKRSSGEDTSGPVPITPKK